MMSENTTTEPEFLVVAVRVKPTEAMIAAGDEAIVAVLNEHPTDVKFLKGTPAERCWAAMIGARRG